MKLSRSYRKTPIVKDRTRGAKTAANRKVRRSSEVSNGANYRRHYPQYDICDWKFYRPLSSVEEELREEDAPHNKGYGWVGCLTPSQYIADWAKRYYWK